MSRFRPCASCKEVQRKTGYSSCRYDPACHKFDPRLIELLQTSDLERLKEAGKAIALGLSDASDVFIARPFPETFEAFQRWLLDAHEMVFGSSGATFGGRFRVRGESIYFGGERRHQREGAPPEFIARRLEELHQRMLSRRQAELSKQMAYFLEEFFCIHPFLDGNGRIGRLFLSLLADKEGFVLNPATNSKGRRRYIKALEYAHDRRSPERRRPCVRNPVGPLEAWIQASLVKPDPHF